MCDWTAACFGWYTRSHRWSDRVTNKDVYVTHLMLCYRLYLFIYFFLSLYLSISVFSPCSWPPLVFLQFCYYISIVTILIVTMFLLHAWCNSRGRYFVTAASSSTVLEEDVGLRQTVESYTIHIKHYTSLHINKSWKLRTCFRKYFDPYNSYIAH